MQKQVTELGGRGQRSTGRPEICHTLACSWDQLVLQDGPGISGVSAARTPGGTSASGHTGSGQTNTQLKAQAHALAPPGIRPTPTYLNDPGDTRQGGEFIGCSFAGCGGH